MAESPPSRGERRAALIELQRLLAEADASLTTDGSPKSPELEQVTQAFDHFRTQYADDAAAGLAPWTASAYARRSALRALATAIAEIDESLSPRDSERIRAAFDVAKQALEVCRRMDESAHSSGLRMRLSAEPDADVPAKRHKKHR